MNEELIRLRGALFDESSIMTFSEDNFAKAIVGQNEFVSNVFGDSRRKNLLKRARDQFLPNSVETILNKNNFKYIYSYLKGQDAKTILVEDRYVSRDFLDGYKGFIADSFQPYSKYCKRIHFFSEEYSGNLICKILEENNLDEIKKLTEQHYLGYSVIRPIPNSVFGLTVLKTILNTNEVHLFGIREYETVIFGRTVYFKTIAYQEQDRMVSACATAAIWFCLNKLAILPRYSLLSPIEITKSSGDIHDNGDRLFPNNGLTPFQIGLAFHNCNIELYKATYEGQNVSKNKISSKLYSYGQLGIPILLVFEIHNDKEKDDPDYKGEFHAVSIVGYKKVGKENVHELFNAEKYEEEVFLHSDLVDTFYAIDDQYGPYVEYKLIGNRKIDTKWNKDFDMSLKPAKKPLEYDKQALVSIQHIFAPLLPKINVDFDSVFRIITILNNIYKSYFDSIKHINTEKQILNWDIKLLLYNEYQKSIIGEDGKNMPGQIKKRILIQHFPKYIWVASLYFNSKKVNDFIFDATALRDSCYLIDIVDYSEDKNMLIGRLLREFFYQKKKGLIEIFNNQNIDGDLWYSRIFELLNVWHCLHNKKQPEYCDDCILQNF